MATRAEREQNEHKAVAAENEELKKKMKDLQYDLEASKLLRLDTKSFLQEATSAHEKGINIPKLFFSLVGSIQEMYQNLLLDEKVLTHHKEELHSMIEISRRVSEYQKQKAADQVKCFSLIELKRFQVMLNSGESLMEEAQGIIANAKKECDRIWESSCAIIAEAGML